MEQVTLKKNLKFKNMFLTTVLHSFTYGFLAGAVIPFFGPPARGDYGFLVNFMLSPLTGASTAAGTIPISATLCAVNHAMAIETAHATPKIVAASVGISAIAHLIYLNKKC